MKIINVKKAYRKYRSAVLCIIFLAMACGEDKNLPRVLLLGDSICGGYYEGVREHLVGKAVVVKPMDNCRDTWTGLEKLDEWLGERRWDVIHFNWVLWDLSHRYTIEMIQASTDPKANIRWFDKAAGGILATSPEQYGENLDALVEKLKRTGTRLIFATTTPVPDGAKGCLKDAELEYNHRAREIMVENSIGQ